MSEEVRQEQESGEESEESISELLEDAGFEVVAIVVAKERQRRHGYSWPC